MGFKGRIVCGHCTALALQTDEVIEMTITACHDAGIDIVSLPTVNMYLQDRSAERAHAALARRDHAARDGRGGAARGRGRRQLPRPVSMRTATTTCSIRTRRR